VLAVCALALASAIAPIEAQAAIGQFVAFVGPDNIAAISLAGTTLAANKPRAYELGERNMFPVIAADIIYEGAAVGLVAGTATRGRWSAATASAASRCTRPTTPPARGDINVEVVECGEIELA
jgi:hypothetical protein